MRLFIASMLIIGMAVSFLWHFSNIYIYGSHFIQEPRLVVLWTEIAVFSGVVLFGVYLFIYSMWRK